MSTCISSHGEFSEHSYGGPDPSDPTDCPAMDRFTCQLCGVFDTDACAKALDASERKRDDLGHRLAAMIRERDEWDADVFAAVVSERDELREQVAAMTRERDKWKRTAERRSTVAAAARCIALEDQLRVAAEEAEYLRQWSNDLAALVPEGDEATYSDPEGAQESILRDVFTAYARERDTFRQALEDVRAALTAEGPGPEYRIGDALDALVRHLGSNWVNGQEDG